MGPSNILANLFKPPEKERPMTNFENNTITGPAGVIIPKPSPYITFKDNAVLKSKESFKAGS